MYYAVSQLEGSTGGTYDLRVSFVPAGAGNQHSLCTASIRCYRCFCCCSNQTHVCSHVPAWDTGCHCPIWVSALRGNCLLFLWMLFDVSHFLHESSFKAAVPYLCGAQCIITPLVFGRGGPAVPSFCTGTQHERGIIGSIYDAPAIGA